MKNSFLSKKTGDIVLIGLLIGVLTFILTYLTLLYWQRDGFDMLEISLMTVLTGFYLFVVIIPVNIILLNKSIRVHYKENLGLTKRFYQVLLTLLLGILTFLIADLMFYYFIDDSIPQEFANSLKQIIRDNNEMFERINKFAGLTFGIQNGLLTFIIGLIGAFISLVFIKKDGQLFKSGTK